MMQSAKNVQMPMSFLVCVMILAFRLDDYALDPETDKLRKSIESQVQSKLNAIEKRKVFSLYKTAPPGSLERNQLRRQYLELANIHKDWVSSAEIPDYLL